jgi:RNA polymerase sigma-70 factor, ECF subfamily
LGLTNTQPATSSRGEERLIREALRGNQKSLDQLFGRYSRALYPTALKLMGNPEDAEDALQDGLLSAFRNLRRFEGRSQFSTWLTRIVINAALMRLRSKRTHPATSIDAEPNADGDEPAPVEMIADHAPSPEEIYARKEVREIFERNLKGLSPTLRSAIVLRDVEGLSTEEAAETLGVPEGTLKSQLHRARVQLASLLRDTLGAKPTGSASPFAGSSGAALCGAEG